MNLYSVFMGSRSHINILGEHVTIFNVDQDEKIESGDIVFIHKRSLLARKAVGRGGYFCVGSAFRVIDRADGYQSVICIDGYRMVYNPENSITRGDIGKVCYFSGPNTVTLDSENKTRAGIIVSVDLSDDPVDIEEGTDRIIGIKFDITEGRNIEW